MSVSVVIPTWNRSKLLVQAIRSALSQTHPPLEVLVCDDGSTDDTEQVIKNINDPRVVWVPGKHSGLPAVPRNRGVACAKGEWLAFLDSDDQWLPDKLSHQLACAGRLSCDAVCCDAFRLQSGMSTPPEVLIGIYKERWTFSDLLTTNRVISSSVLVKTNLLRSVGGFPDSRTLIVGEDYALWLRVATMTDFAFLDSPLLIYADFPQISIRSASSDTWHQRRKVLENFLVWGIRKFIPADFLKDALYNYGKVFLFLTKRQYAHSRERLLRRKLLE